MGYDYNGRLGTLWVQYEGPDVGHGIEWGLTTRTYGYTPSNRMSWFVRHHDNYNSGGVSENGNGDGYYYDAAGQLVKTLHETENLEGTDDDHGNSYVNESHYNALYELRYTLDGVGNRQQVAYRDPALPPNNDVITPYGTADSLNRYPTVGGQTASYDLRGNLIGLGSSTYTFNALNQLTSASVNGHTASFNYDPLGRCVLRTLDNVTTHLYYEGWNLIEERDAADNLLYTYIHGPDTDEMLCRVTAGTGERLYYHQDALGHVTDLTDAYGNLVEKYLYGPFGQPTVLDATGHPRANNQSLVGNRFLFCGREWLAPLGLYDNRALYYSPDLGRFLQPDPAGYEASGVNLYAYCDNDPVNNSDPSGLFVEVVAQRQTGTIFTLLNAVGIVPTHTAIVIHPDAGNAGLFNGVNTGVDGSISLSAGPGGPGGINLNTYRTDQDADQIAKTPGLVVNRQTIGDDQDGVRLLEAFNGYQNGQNNYAGYPIFGDFFNSNGFVAGLLNAIGLDGPRIVGGLHGYAGGGSRIPPPFPGPPRPATGPNSDKATFDRVLASGNGTYTLPSGVTASASSR